MPHCEIAQFHNFTILRRVLGKPRDHTTWNADSADASQTTRTRGSAYSTNGLRCLRSPPPGGPVRGWAAHWAPVCSKTTSTTNDNFSLAARQPARGTRLREEGPSANIERLEIRFAAIERHPCFQCRRSRFHGFPCCLLRRLCVLCGLMIRNTEARRPCIQGKGCRQLSVDFPAALRSYGWAATMPLGNNQEEML